MTTRRLAAILAADVVGFSSMMERDEEGTAAAIRSLRREVVEPALSRHAGRLVKTTGDGFLVEFASPVEAVRSAVAIQDALAAGPNGLRLRIGVNLGDIIIEDDGDVFGEGVNVAARLEQMADPGGVLVSGKIYEEVEGKIDRCFESRGEQQVKNLARPVRVYALAGGKSPKTEPKPLPLPDKPSIAVLPFTNMSGDPEQEYLADGLSDDLIMSLTKAGWLFVLGRNSTFAFKGQGATPEEVGRKLDIRYVLLGTVRKSGNKVRISAQLVDSNTGSSLWAERYDRDTGDIFALQDEIATQVAGAIEPELLRKEAEFASSHPERNFSAWDHVRRGMWEFHKVAAASHATARRLFLRALEIEPNSASGWIWLARVDSGLVNYGWADDAIRIITEGADAAGRAVELEPKNPYSHYAVACTYIHLDDGAARAARAAEHALSLNPSFALGHFGRGVAQLHLGHLSGATTSIRQGLLLSPFDPQTFTWHLVASLAHYFAGEPNDALEAALRALELRPSWPPALKMAALSHLALGCRAEAELLVRKGRTTQPPEIDVLRSFVRRRPDWAAHIEQKLASITTGALT